MASGSTERLASAGALWVPPLTGMLQNLARMVILQQEVSAVGLEHAVKKECKCCGLAARFDVHWHFEPWDSHQGLLLQPNSHLRITGMLQHRTCMQFLQHMKGHL